MAQPMNVQIKQVWLVVLAIGLTACSTAPQGSIMNSVSVARAVDLPDLGPAPELTNSVWLNTDSPLRLADLRGKVVGVEMWTFGCINCQHVIPSLKSWYARYRDGGFVLIGNHFPEFGAERDLGKLTQAVAQAGIQYPVAQDNDGATWNAFHNNYWPALYLIDKRGRIRYVHTGEGAYAETEANIQRLLAETYP
jgi:thiol-disulfide isomerase/thioredoxin